MSNRVGRVLAIGALVLGIPGACIGAIALYGRALAESDVAVGTLVSPAEAQARLERARAVFAAMTPAQHLAAARGALDAGYDAETRTGGNFGGLRHHLDAIPAGAPEQAAATALRAEAQGRWVRLLELAHQRIVRQANERRGASADPALRTAVALDVDQLSPRGLGCVHVADESASTLRFDNGACQQAMLDAIAPTDAAASLRGLGFRRVRCANGRGVIEL